MRREDLATFLHLADGGSLSATARALNVPKSSVSRLIARLEAEFGQPLFDRSTRHFRLSDAGVVLRPYAEQVVNTLIDAQTALDGVASEPQGLLRVNTTPSFAQGLIAPLLPGYLRRYPKVSVELTTDNRYIDVIHEDVDVMLRVGSLAESPLPAMRLPSIELLLCASPSYLAGKEPPERIEDVVRHQIVARELRPMWTFRNGATEKMIQPAARAVLPDAAAQRALIEGGGGIGCLPSYVIAPALRDGTLMLVLPEWRRAPIDIHAVFPSHHRMSAKLRSFIDALNAHLQQDGVTGAASKT